MEFASWMVINVPVMVATILLSWVYLQVVFMGLFRPNSADAKKIRIGKQGEVVANKLLKQKLEEMGPMSFHEIMVGLMFLLSVALWFFRKPQFITGWAEMITQHKVSFPEKNMHVKKKFEIKFFFGSLLCQVTLLIRATKHTNYTIFALLPYELLQNNLSRRTY